MKLYFKQLNTPIGNIYLISCDKYLRFLFWNKKSYLEFAKKNLIEKESSKVLNLATSELEEYFLGKRNTFSTPLCVEGTPFQKQVWNKLQTIPYGKTISYKDLAIKIKKENAFRAVGSANGKNPIGIFIPCHRVIATNGKLSGFAGGINAKSKLIALEATGRINNAVGDALD